MQRQIVLVVAVLLAMVVIGCGRTEAEKAVYGKAADFELQDINGKSVRLSDFSGKIIILNFFATWCPPCRSEMPDFNEVTKEYRDDVKIVAVAVSDNLERVKQYATNNGLEFVILMDDGKASTLYGPITGIPTTFFIDKEFTIIRKYLGPRRKDTLIQYIRELE